MKLPYQSSIQKWRGRICKRFKIDSDYAMIFQYSPSPLYKTKCTLDFHHDTEPTSMSPASGHFVKLEFSLEEGCWWLRFAVLIFPKALNRTLSNSNRFLGFFNVNDPFVYHLTQFKLTEDQIRELWISATIPSHAKNFVEFLHPIIIWLILKGILMIIILSLNILKVSKPYCQIIRNNRLKHFPFWIFSNLLLFYCHMCRSSRNLHRIYESFNDFLC